LQDFAYFLQHFKRDNNINSKVVAFGGSYGGMLASWFRMKYPNVIDGAVAMSAPIYYFANRANLDINVFFKISTQDFTQYDYFIQPVHRSVRRAPE
jgi:pimeloyl-ACP methyl ester carboxylesterase